MIAWIIGLSLYNRLSQLDNKNNESFWPLFNDEGKHYWCTLKEFFTPKKQKENADKCIRLQFVSSSELILRNFVLYDLLTNESSAVNGCHQNESPNSWYNFCNNPQVMHITPIHEFNDLWSEKL